MGFFNEADLSKNSFFEHKTDENQIDLYMKHTTINFV